ncbi:MAG: TM0106 family RecB-like putative nuclease [Synechococcales cyanobacterium RU_4_20]|nr:TM0106 family RecB-like putative nuclease [Synechococcales cyanobacterium RU_4_20]
MQNRGDRLLYAPSDLIQYLQSEFACWMERCALENPAIEQPEPDQMMRVLTQLGQEHERSYVESLRQAGAEIYEIDSRGGFQATLAAMYAGKPLIYQGALAHGDWLGYADFLVRVEGRGASPRGGESRFGAWHYAPLECKLAMNPKPYFVLQACAYCELLEQVQGVRPQQFGLILGNGDRREFSTEDYFHYYRQVHRSFMAFMAEFDPQRRPLPRSTDHGIWQTLAEQVLVEVDHLSLVANITQNQIKKLEAAGITSLGALAIATLSNGLPNSIAKLTKNYCGKQGFSLVARATVLLMKFLLPPADKPHSGLAMLPPASALDVFFDLEGYPLADGGMGLEYLFGATYLNETIHEPVDESTDEQTTQVLKFKDWWAHDDTMEKRAFEGFMDWIWERWQRDPAMHVYHYAPYETTALKRLMGRYGTREEELDSMLRGGVFVDLYRVVTQGLCVGTPSYSIKSLEQFYWRKREGEVKNAQASVVQYFQWHIQGHVQGQQQRDGNTPEDSAILREIRDYNRDDCDSTQALADWLRSLQTLAGISYVPPSTAETTPETIPETTPETRADLPEFASQHRQLKEPSPAAQLALALLEQPSSETSAQSSAQSPAQSLGWASRSLLAHLLQFHRREAKPFWWQRFTWLVADETDLLDELDCLVGLERTDRLPFRPTPRSKSWAYEYRFDPSQETRLRSKTTCWFFPQPH